MKQGIILLNYLFHLFVLLYFNIKIIIFYHFCYDINNFTKLLKNIRLFVFPLKIDHIIYLFLLFSK